jgi:hypothetical protein
MPVWNIARIVPVGKMTAWQTATALGGDADGLGATGNVYESSEPIPRTNITHKAGNGAPNAAQLAFLEGLGTDVNGFYIMPMDLDGVIAAKWDRALGPSASPYPLMLSSNGLTDQANV